MSRLNIKRLGRSTQPLDRGLFDVLAAHPIDPLGDHDLGVLAIPDVAAKKPRAALPFDVISRTPRDADLRSGRLRASSVALARLARLASRQSLSAGHREILRLKIGLAAAEFALLNHPLLSVGVVLDPVLRRVLDRKQANDRVTTSASVVGAAAREEIYDLTHAKFMIQHGEKFSGKWIVLKYRPL
jgi:hypothetical protein